MIFVIGGKGLTGSAIVRYLQEKDIEYEIIQKENKEKFLGKNCDILIFANGNALKYKANEDPYFDFHASISSIVEYIHGINYKLFVHLSTVDVYDKKSSLETTKETAQIDTTKLDTYGFHKLLAEDYVRRYCPKYLIFRLPGLVGTGLKKNPAYDFIHKHKKSMISADSIQNFIDTDFIAKTIFKIIDHGIINEVFNLAAKNSIRFEDIKNITGYDTEYTEDSTKHIQNYQINVDKIQRLVEMPSTEDSIKKYFMSLTESR